ncbi:MAG TPA: DUF1844 domain-containing protein, partial [Terriglobales bacterium]|nr:DUF1844 domain-containing protein [Terriglobales bacterium]
MAERGETGFKVTDRRKYNPDGSPRESAEAEAETIASDAEAQAPPAAPAANNVLSFPGEPSKTQSEPAPEAGGASETSAAEAEPTAEQLAAGQAEQAYNQARGPNSGRLPEPSFLSLVNMLGVEAAMHLGLIQTPGEEPLPVDTEAARHLLDLLGTLQTKTRGNLTEEEDRLFENMLADLRMQFVT